jgi:predicted methyltransferase
MRHLFAASAAIVAAALPVAATAQSSALAAAVNNPARPQEEKARDRYRHPLETLTFFGVKPEQTVVEYSPGGGWYTRILMPLVANKGRYVAVVGNSPRAIEGATKLVAGLPGASAAKVLSFDPANASMGLDGTADRVLTFRNVHNLLMAGAGNGQGDKVALAFFQAAFKALKPGGVLGVVDHRLPESADAERERKSGYVKRSTVVALATRAGFKLDGESAINANPKDTADWPNGVWTLPPSLQLGEQDKAKYLAIGESDRMTLRFVKPL